MITEAEIYWITRLDYFQTLGFIVGGILTFASLICLFASVDDWIKEENKTGFCISLSFFVLFLFVLFGACFIPSTKEMCAIKALPMVMNNEGVREIPNKVVGLANEWLDEMRPERKMKGD